MTYIKDNTYVILNIITYDEIKGDEIAQTYCNGMF